MHPTPTATSALAHRDLTAEAPSTSKINHRTAARPANQRVWLRGLDADVEVRRHPSARRMTLRVSRTRRAVIVTLPVQCDLGAADTFIARHIDWLKERLLNLPRFVAFAHGAIIPLRGVPHEIKFMGPERASCVVETLREADGGRTLAVSGHLEHAPRRLQDWLAAEARRDLTQRVLVHAQRLGLQPKRITVRDQVSRWGSCSTTGALSFSWRLILTPPAVLDYVAAHEVAHLAEMNHGPRFWALVRLTNPGMDDAKAWLKVHGIDLHRFGAEA